MTQETAAMTTTTLARPASILTADQLRRVAPSIFAESPWGRMSHRYRMVPTIEVVAMLADRGFRPVLAKQSRSRVEGKGDFTRHLIRFRHDDHMGESAGAEVPELVLTNSHDGTSAYRFMSGVFRLVCSNGLTVQSADFGSISVRHSGGRDFEQRVIDATCEVIEDAPRTLEKIEGWKAIELAGPQREAFASAVLEARDATVEVSPADVLAPRRGADRRPDLWTTANVLQENVIKGGVQGVSATTGRRMRTRAVSSVAEDVRLNRALWALTERMAELSQ
jgi:hypothetical protein